jgi:hypothetical protein
MERERRLNGEGDWVTLHLKARHHLCEGWRGEVVLDVFFHLESAQEGMR